MTQNRFYHVIIAVLTVLLFFQWYCKRCPKCPDVKERIVTVTVKDTGAVKHPEPVAEKKPDKTKPIVDYKFDTLWLPELVDTVAILEKYSEVVGDYATQRYYEDTTHVFAQDSTYLGYVLSKDSVQFNRLRYHQLFTDLAIPVKERVIKERKGIFLAGITGGYGSKENPLSAFGLQGMYVSKGGNGYGLGTMIFVNGGKIAYISINKKIGR